MSFGGDARSMPVDGDELLWTCGGRKSVDVMLRTKFVVRVVRVVTVIFADEVPWWMLPWAFDFDSK